MSMAKGPFKCYITRWRVRFPVNKCYECVRFNVISVTRGWVSVKYPGKKRYVTLEWPLTEYHIILIKSLCPPQPGPRWVWLPIVLRFLFIPFSSCPSVPPSLVPAGCGCRSSYASSSSRSHHVPLFPQPGPRWVWLPIVLRFLFIPFSSCPSVPPAWSPLGVAADRPTLPLHPVLIVSLCSPSLVPAGCGCRSSYASSSSRSHHVPLFPPAWSPLGVAADRPTLPLHPVLIMSLCSPSLVRAGCGCRSSYASSSSRSHHVPLFPPAWSALGVAADRPTLPLHPVLIMSLCSPQPGPRWVWLPIVLRFLFIPFFCFCNYKPDIRSLPVFIDNDYVYCAGGILMALTSGYFSSLCMMYVPR